MKFGPPPCFGKISLSALITAGLVGLSAFADGGIITTNKITASSSEDIVIAADEVLQVDCTSDVTLSGLISGEGKIYKTGSKSLTLSCHENTFSGGIHVGAGTLYSKLQNDDTTVFGSGPIRVDSGNGARLNVSTRPWNDIEFVGSSSASKAGLIIGGQAYFYGDIVSHGDLYISDGYSNRPNDRNSSKAVIGTATTSLVIDPGYRLAAAPNPTYQFDCPITADLVKGFWVDNSDNVSEELCPTRGCVGAFLFKNTNTIGKVEIDQIRFRCAKANALKGTVVEFTGEHLCDGWGYLEFSGVNQDIAALITPNTVAAGCQISNSTATAATITLSGKAGLTADGVLRLCGAFNPIHVLPDLPADFTQVFRDCEVPLESELMLNSGTIGFTGTATATGVSKVALGKLASLSIIGTDCKPFTDNQIVLEVALGTTIHLENDLVVQKLLVDGAECPAGEYEGAGSPLITITGNGTLTVSEGVDPKTIKTVVVPAGETVTGVTISAEQTLRKFGPGTLVLNAANAYSGGTEICGGIIEVQDKDALGTGAVTVCGFGDRSAQLVFNLPEEATVANDLVIETASSLDYPALHFASKTVLSGDVHAKANLYLSTAWGDDPAAASQENVRFSGAVTVDEGACIGGAPHCIVSFEGVLKTPLLDCCYTANGQASNGGNAGWFLLNNKANDIQQIRIDQTGLRCGVASSCTNTVLEWVDNGHLADDLGRFEFTGNQKVSDIITPVIAKGGGGCVITNFGSSAVTFTLCDCIGARDCYARFDGLLNFEFRRDIAETSSGMLTFKNRRHLMKGSLYNARKQVTIGEGSAFPFATGVSNANASRLYVTSEEEDVLDGMTTVAIGSTEYTFNETAVKSLSKGRDVLLRRTTGSLVLNGNTPLEVKAFHNNRSSGGPTFYYRTGEYTSAGSATTFKFNYETTGTKLEGGPVLVWSDNLSGTREGWTNMVWTGASETTTDVNDLDNWATLPQYVSFKVPAAWVKFAAAGKTEASLTNDVVWGGLTFTAESAGFTLKNGEGADTTISVYDNGIDTVRGEGDVRARTFTIKPKLDLQTTTPLTIAANDTLVLEQGLVNATRVSVTGGGTLVLGGTIPADIAVDGGTLAFAEGAVVPDVFDRIAVANGGTIDMPGAAKVVTAAAYTVDGVDMLDDDYQVGDLTIRLRSGKVPKEPTQSATWTGGAGEDTSLTTAANWDAVPLFNAGAQLNFAAAGERATVSGETMAHTLNFENLAEIADEGPTAFTLKGATGNPAENVLTVYGKVLVDQSKVPLTLEDVTLATPQHADQGAPGNNGMKTLTLTSQNSNDAFPLTLKNAIVEKPIYAYGPDRRRTIIVASGTNEIKGAFTYATSKWHDMTISAGATLILSGGVSCNWKTAITGSGTLIITNKPWVSTQGGVENGNGQIQFGGDLVWAVASNKLGGVGGNAGYQFSSGAVADYLCNDVFTYPTELRFYAKNSATACHDLHTTTQRVGSITWSQQNPCTVQANAAYFTGEEGSMLWLDSWGVSSNAFSFVGNLAFRKSGEDECILQRTEYMRTNNQVVQHTTTGPLLVEEGRLTLEEGVRWLNGDITISGTGVLAVSESGQIGKTLSLAFEGENSQLFIPGGATVRVARATVDGEPVEDGVYTVAKPGPFEGHLTGAGALRVGKLGMTLLVK